MGESCLLIDGDNVDVVVGLGLILLLLPPLPVGAVGAPPVDNDDDPSVLALLMLLLLLVVLSFEEDGGFDAIIAPIVTAAIAINIIITIKIFGLL